MQHDFYDTPWADEPMPSTTPIQQQETTMPTSDNLYEFFGQLGQYPRNNVLERVIQSLITESARADEFSDRVAFGDDVMHALPVIELDELGHSLKPIDSWERPAPDTDGTTGRTLSEAQYNLLTSLEEDSATALAMAAELVGVYEAHNGEKPPYGFYKTPQGAFVRITDIHQALKREYIRAHAQWLKRNSAEAKEGFDKAGADALREHTRSTRARTLSAF